MTRPKRPEFHKFDPYDMLMSQDATIKLLSKNILEVAKAHNVAQHQLDLATERINEMTQEILDLRNDLAELINLLAQQPLVK